MDVMLDLPRFDPYFHDRDVPLRVRRKPASWRASVERIAPVWSIVVTGLILLGTGAFIAADLRRRPMPPMLTPAPAPRAEELVEAAICSIRRARMEHEPGSAPWNRPLDYERHPMRPAVRAAGSLETRGAERPPGR